MIIPFHRPAVDEREAAAAADAVRSGWLTMGNRTIEFEERFGRYVGAPYAVSVNSCTAALHLALKVAGVGPGDEVLVPAMTFVSSASVAVHLGARPGIVDIERDTHLMDPADLERKITKRSRAVVPVHYAGQPCDVDGIAAIAKRNGLIVIHDAAHALPATYRGATIGSLPDITCFSFYATKTLTTGEGGMATLGREDWADRMRRLRLHGIDKDAWKRYQFGARWEYDVREVGFKCNLTDIAASIGLAQLDRVDDMRRERASIARRYGEAFAANESLIPYATREDRECAWHLYPLKLALETFSIDRDRFIVELQERGIGTSVHFIPLHRFTWFRENGYGECGCPNADWVFGRMLSLPIFPGMTDEEVGYVIESVVEIAKKFRR